MGGLSFAWTIIGMARRAQFNERKPHPHVPQIAKSASWKRRHPKLKEAAAVGGPIAYSVAGKALLSAANGTRNESRTFNSMNASAHLGTKAGAYYLKSTHRSHTAGTVLRGAVIGAPPVIYGVHKYRKQRRTKHGKGK